MDVCTWVVTDEIKALKLNISTYTISYSIFPSTDYGRVSNQTVNPNEPSHFGEPEPEPAKFYFSESEPSKLCLSVPNPNLNP